MSPCELDKDTLGCSQRQKRQVPDMDTMQDADTYGRANF